MLIEQRVIDEKTLKTRLLLLIAQPVQEKKGLLG
jgi:hypothetical protein